MSEFFAMGGHAAFIWPCYGLTAVVMIFLVVQSIRSMRVNEKLVETLRAGRARRRERRADPPAASTADKTELEAEA
jgi:heme exporter protein D